MDIIALVLCICKCDSYLAHQSKLRSDRDERVSIPILHETSSIGAFTQKIISVANTVLGNYS